ncbi:MAG TPA: GspH/FimT family protein, partial [Thiobacillus sp.]
TSCTGAWHQGWVVFHDINNNAALDAGETVILKQPGMPDGFRLTGNSHVSDYISYMPTGATEMTSGAFQSGTLTVCRQSYEEYGARRIVISRTGRPRIETTTLASCP